MSGPLEGCRIVEVASIGPGPLGGMLLADLGADVVRVERPEDYADHTARRFEVMLRNRRSVALDLKSAAGLHGLLSLVDEADGLIEGFRPGVMERLGAGPATCLARNPRLVYARMTGWGQTGPLSAHAGHDINYLSVAGCLAHLPSGDGVPRAPLNLIGDFGAGGTMLALGLLAGILEARASGSGQVVDVSMADGIAALMAMFHGYEALSRQERVPDPSRTVSGAPFYASYRCSDDRFVSIGAVEPKFYQQLVALLGLTDAELFADQWDESRWDEMSEMISTRILSRSRDEWTGLAEETDACMTPVLTMDEAREDPHLRERGTFVCVDGVPQPAPPIRMSRSSSPVPVSPASGRSTVEQVVGAWAANRSGAHGQIARAAPP